MNFLLGGAGRLVTGSGKFALVGVVGVFFMFATYYVLYHSTIGEARPGTPLFWPSHEFNVATAEIAETFGISQFICWFNTGGLISHQQVMESMTLFAEKVMPYID